MTDSVSKDVESKEEIKEEVASVTDDTPLTVEELTDRVKNLNGINKELMDTREELRNKVRKIESTAADKQLKLDEANKEFEKLYNDQKDLNIVLQGDIKKKIIDAALRSRLDSEGCKDIETTMMLMDVSDVEVIDGEVSERNITDVVLKVKERSGLLFGEKTMNGIPDLKAVNSGVSQTYEQQIKGFKTSAELLDFVNTK